jgi:hypothetical protein
MAQSGETKAHENTYGGFVRLLKVGTIVTVLVTALVVFLIAS